MAIENEVVRFVAEIELDPQDKAALPKQMIRTMEDTFHTIKH